MLQASSNCSLRGKTDGIFWKRLHEVGLQLLEQAKTFSWAEVSHCGFRPMNALGHNHAMDAWNDAHSKLPRKWPAAQFHTDSLLFPCDGLGTKVLTDRILEVLELCELVTPESFLARFAAIPIISSRKWEAARGWSAYSITGLCSSVPTSCLASIRRKAC